MGTTKKLNGFSLIEMVLAVAILAISFLPIIGTLGGSVKGTQHDEQLGKGYLLADNSLKTALQFQFLELPKLKSGDPPGGGPWAWTASAAQNLSSQNGNLVLPVGTVTQGRYSYLVSLTITDVGAQFSVPAYTPADKANATNTPSSWGWTTLTSPNYNEVFHQYVLTVKWVDGRGKDQFYTLVGYKAKLEE